MKEYLKNICGEYAQDHNFSGVCMLKRKGETVFSEAYGYASRPFHVLNNVDTRFDTASITKIFTAAAVLQLVQEGKLRLADKIVNIVDLSGTRIPDDVTIEHLLNHTSGIADDADEEAGEEYSALFIDSPNYAIRECRDFLKNFAYKEPNFRAGTNVRYCNCSYVLLGMAIEEVSGVNYRDYFIRHIFERAGMDRTGFFSMDGVQENTAEGYKNIQDAQERIIGYQKNIYCYPPVGTPDGGAYTTAGDLNLFLDAVRGHILLNGEYADIFLRPHCEFSNSVEWLSIPGMCKQNGYGFEFYLLEKEDIPFCIYKDGCNDGVAAKFLYYPREDVTLTVLSNQDCDIWSMVKHIQVEIYNRYYCRRDTGFFNDTPGENRV